MGRNSKNHTQKLDIEPKETPETAHCRNWRLFQRHRTLDYQIISLQDIPFYKKQCRIELPF